MVWTGWHGFNYPRRHKYVSSPDLEESRETSGKIFSGYRWLHHNNVFLNTTLLLSMSAKSIDLPRCPYTTYHYNKTNQMHWFLKFILEWNSICFEQFLCPSSGVISLYTQQWYMSYRFADSLRAACLQAVRKTVKNSWWWTEELSETSSFIPKKNLRN